MELDKAENTINGFLTKLFRGLLENRGFHNKLVGKISEKKMKLSDKDFLRLKRLIREGSITFTSFIWLLTVLLNVRRITIRVRTEDKDGNINEVEMSSILSTDGVLKD